MNHLFAIRLMRACCRLIGSQPAPMSSGHPYQAPASGNVIEKDPIPRFVKRWATSFEPSCQSPLVAGSLRHRFHWCGTASMGVRRQWPLVLVTSFAQACIFGVNLLTVPKRGSVAFALLISAYSSVVLGSSYTYINYPAHTLYWTGHEGARFESPESACESHSAFEGYEYLYTKMLSAEFAQCYFRTAGGYVFAYASTSATQACNEGDRMSNSHTSPKTCEHKYTIPGCPFWPDLQTVGPAMFY